MIRKLLIILFIYIGLFSCNFSKSKTNRRTVNVYCAASLTNVLNELEIEFEKNNDADIRLNIASSGTLARQISEGAPADIFLSANKKWMNHINSIGFAEKGTELNFAINSLVVIAPVYSETDTVIFKSNCSFSDFFEGRLSIGDPDFVPAGEYVREALQNMGCYSDLQDRLLRAKDIRSALMVVELGETEVGIVYKTDALKSDKVRIIGTIPDTLHQPINYYSTVIKGNKNELTMNFYTFIFSKQALPVWKRNGFNL